jgi:DNA-directed RNA polymerase subunit RPC12/RpoP
MSNPQPQNMRVPMPDISKAANVECEECGSDTFVQIYMMKKFSALVSPTGQEMLAPIQLYACKDCEHVNSEFLPPGMRGDA